MKRNNEYIYTNREGRIIRETDGKALQGRKGIKDANHTYRHTYADSDSRTMIFLDDKNNK
jgi:hypothetical protein